MESYYAFPRNNGKSMMQNLIVNLKSRICKLQDSTKPLGDNEAIIQSIGVPSRNNRMYTVDVLKSGIETFMNSLGIKDGVNTSKHHDDSCDALLYAVQYTNSDTSPLYINTEEKFIKDDLYYR